MVIDFMIIKKSVLLYSYNKFKSLYDKSINIRYNQDISLSENNYPRSCSTIHLRLCTLHFLELKTSKHAVKSSRRNRRTDN